MTRDNSSNQNQGSYSTSASATTQQAVDSTPPTPNPSTWATAPHATGTTTISMTATTASDPSGVQYFFHCLTAGGHDSGWQASATCQDTGLSPNTTYTYQVMTRDNSANQNQGNYSTSAAATTLQVANNPPQLSGVGASTNGMFLFSLNGPVGGNYVVQASSDLVNWVNVVTNVIPASGVRVFDFPMQTNQPQLFYRALPLAQGPLVLQPGPVDGEDIWTTSVYSNGTNTVGANGIADENFLVGGWADYYYSYIKFDLTALPAQATSATVQLYSFTGWHGGYVNVSMYLDRVTQDWDAIFATGIMKWADQPASTNLRTIAAPDTGTWYSFDVTDLYNAWQAGTYPNYGIVLRPMGNSDQFNYFWSSRYLVDPTLRPKLVILP
jgi:hypothetical protein